MSLRSLLIPPVAERLTGVARLNRLREKAEKQRRAAGEPHRVDYFHQADDPYSCLLAQLLPVFAERYDISLQCHLVPAPQDWAAPERQRLEAWSLKDAHLLARKAGLAFPEAAAAPSAERRLQAEAVLAASLAAGRFPAEAGATSLALWAGEGLPAVRQSADAAKAGGEALRERLGHYLGGMLHYGGEWYWGVDRLHYLEERLAELGARRAPWPVTPLYAQPVTPLADAAPGSGGELHAYLSFRSPYSWIAAGRVKTLAERYGLQLRVRMVMPMVMRGLPVPARKRSYIMADAAREARRAGVPFGRICDPVGRPVERGYALLPWARDQGRGFEYCEAFMRATWSMGVDAGTGSGLARIVAAAGLDWRLARSLTGETGWREEAEMNRGELLSLGLWGVPSFRFGDTSAWGQDRLWVIEDAIRAERVKDSRGDRHAGK